LATQRERRKIEYIERNCFWLAFLLKVDHHIDISGDIGAAFLMRKKVKRISFDAQGMEVRIIMHQIEHKINTLSTFTASESDPKDDLPISQLNLKIFFQFLSHTIEFNKAWRED
jgi:hypothetical protein